MNCAKSELQITLNKIILKMVYEWLGFKIGLLAEALKIGFVEKGLSSVDDMNSHF